MHIRHPLLASVVSALIAAAPQASGVIFLVDFGAATTPTATAAAPADDPVRTWNNVSGIGTTDGGQLLDLVNTTNGVSTIDLVIVNRFNGANENGVTNSTIYPSNATRDSLFGNTEVFNGLTNIFPKLKLTSLNAATLYNFTFYASRNGVTDNRETGYTVTGATNGFAALNPANNIDGVATVLGIKPDAAGEISISLAPTANNTNTANHFTYLGVLKIESVPEPSVCALLAGGMLLRSRRRRAV